MSAITRFFAQGASNNISENTWNLNDVAHGVRDGLLNNQPWLIATSILSENTLPPITFFIEDYTMGSRKQILPLLSIVYVFVGMFFLNNRMMKVLQPNSTTQISAIYLATSLLSYANLRVVQKNLSSQTTNLEGMNKICFAVHRATPYVVIVTNLALTALELRTNRMRAVVALATTAAYLLPYFKIVSKANAWYLNVGLRFPMDLVAIYYGNNWTRFKIVAEWPLAPYLQAKAANYFFKAK